MPRFARLHAPGALVHLISRFVNREFLLAGQAERDAYLARLATALGRSDWRLLSYALMSSHVHLVLVAGQDEPWRLLKVVNTAFACWLNHAHRRLGPVFAERATTLLLDPDDAARLIAYVHNNPVRAGVARDPSDTLWTSHRACLGMAPVPPWLEVGLALTLSGFDSSPSGRAGFHQFVCGGSQDPRDAELAGRKGTSVRRDVRRHLALPVEMASPQLDTGRAQWPILHPGIQLIEPRWPGDLHDLVDHVCAARGIPREQVCSRDRTRRVVAVRRLALVVGARLLRREVGEVAAVMGLSCAAGSKLLRSAAGVMEEARAVAGELRRNGEQAVGARGQQLAV